nr:vegetative incompatibility protein het-e-1 [Quercus suber]
MDSCCIDQKSAAELSEGVNCMFDWYRNVRVCIVYLPDVERPSDIVALRNSVWFKRGWTLQELLASTVEKSRTQQRLKRGFRHQIHRQTILLPTIRFLWCCEVIIPYKFFRLHLTNIIYIAVMLESTGPLHIARQRFKLYHLTREIGKKGMSLFERYGYHKRCSCVYFGPHRLTIAIDDPIAINNAKELLKSSKLEAIKRFCKAISSLMLSRGFSDCDSTSIHLLANAMEAYVHILNHQDASQSKARRLSLGSSSNTILRIKTHFEDANQRTSRFGRNLLKPLKYWVNESRGYSSLSAFHSVRKLHKKLKILKFSGFELFDRKSRFVVHAGSSRRSFHCVPPITTPVS